jgi:hypothetical protein
VDVGEGATVIAVNLTDFNASSVACEGKVKVAVIIIVAPCKWGSGNTCQTSVNVRESSAVISVDSTCRCGVQQVECS